MEKPLGPKLLWQPGVWWVIRTSFFSNISTLKDGPEKLGVREFYHRYSIVGKERLGEKEAWVIDIGAMHVPPEFPNDQGDKYLWRVYLNTQNFTLQKIVSCTRDGDFLVTGDHCTTDTIEMHMGNPAVVTRFLQLTPLEFPRLPAGVNPGLLDEDEKELDFKDESSFQEFKQTIISARQTVDKQQAATWYITLGNKENGISTFFWIPGLPWWKEWRHVSVDRRSSGMFKAELVEWGTNPR